MLLLHNLWKKVLAFILPESFNIKGTTPHIKAVIFTIAMYLIEIIFITELGLRNVIPLK